MVNPYDDAALHDLNVKSIRTRPPHFYVLRTGPSARLGPNIICRDQAIHCEVFSWIAVRPAPFNISNTKKFLYI